MCARAAIRVAYLNVRTNASGLEDKAYAATALATGAQLAAQAEQFEQEVLAIVEGKM